MRAFRKNATYSVALLLLSACGGSNFVPDPDTGKQWYLYKNEKNPSLVSINLPIDSAYSGNGVLVAVVDNGVDIDHEDLARNVVFGNFSYLPQDYGFTNADHGTAVAGIIAAVEGNGIGGRGVAPGASIVAFNALRTPSLDNVADALSRDIDRVSVSNNSWGDFNSWGEPIWLRESIRSALAKGTALGRNGLGIVYVFSAGNGALVDNKGIPSDNVNYSGLVNNYFTLPICAVDQHGIKTNYSETGASLLVCAPSKSDKKSGIFTTDVSGDALGYNTKKTTNDVENKSYTSQFGGTSAAAPMVSGVVALMLEANPNLSWRDVRLILASTAQKNAPTDSDWKTNSAGLHVNHKYGFGLVDATAAINAAQNWVNLPPSMMMDINRVVNQEIPDNGANGIESAIWINDHVSTEFVDIYLDIPDHKRIGDLEVVLTSPNGTQSMLSERHNQMFESFFYRNWRFGTVRHLGENANGYWHLSVKDKRAGESGTWASWRLVIHGYKKESALS